MADPGKVFDEENNLSAIPANVQYFSRIESDTRSQLSLTFSKQTIAVLLVLLIFHSAIIIFCIFILIMSCVSGAQQARWLVKSLYVKNQSGQKVYKSPLYFFNAGILMAVSQLLCSAAAEAYIWVEIKSSQSIHFAAGARLSIPIGIGFIFETLSHWCMIHCFLVTFYFSRGFNGEMRKGLMRWISPPTLINLLFICFPALVVVGIACMISWTSFRHHQLAIEVWKALDILKEGSAAWAQLQDKTKPASEQQLQISNHIIELIFRLKEIFNGTDSHEEKFLFAFHWFEVTMFVITCMTLVVFILVFYLLVQKYRYNHRKSSVLIVPRSEPFRNFFKSGERVGDASGTHSISTSPGEMAMLMSRNKIFYLLLRSFGVFLSMMTQMITYLIFLIKTSDAVKDKHWREVSTWLVIFSGAWSSIPIALQCWRLYVDQTNVKKSNSTETTPSGVLPPVLQSTSLLQPGDTREVDLEIRLPHGFLLR